MKELHGKKRNRVGFRRSCPREAVGDSVFPGVVIKLRKTCERMDLAPKGITVSGVGLEDGMKPSICRCCGERMTEDRNPPSRNPNICTLCSSRLDGVDPFDVFETMLPWGEQDWESTRPLTETLIAAMNQQTGTEVNRDIFARR